MFGIQYHFFCDTKQRMKQSYAHTLIFTKVWKGLIKRLNLIIIINNIHFICKTLLGFVAHREKHFWRVWRAQMIFFFLICRDNTTLISSILPVARLKISAYNVIRYCFLHYTNFPMSCYTYFLKCFYRIHKPIQKNYFTAGHEPQRDITSRVVAASFANKLRSTLSQH